MGINLLILAPSRTDGSKRSWHIAIILILAHHLGAQFMIACLHQSQL